MFATSDSLFATSAPGAHTHSTAEHVGVSITKKTIDIYTTSSEGNMFAGGLHRGFPTLVCHRDWQDTIQGHKENQNPFGKYRMCVSQAFATPSLVSMVQCMWTNLRPRRFRHQLRLPSHCSAHVQPTLNLHHVINGSEFWAWWACLWVKVA